MAPDGAQCGADALGIIGHKGVRAHQLINGRFATREHGVASVGPLDHLGLKVISLIPLVPFGEFVAALDVNVAFTQSGLVLGDIVPFCALPHDAQLELVELEFRLFTIAHTGGTTALMTTATKGSFHLHVHGVACDSLRVDHVDDGFSFASAAHKFGETRGPNCTDRHFGGPCLFLTECTSGGHDLGHGLTGDCCIIWHNGLLGGDCQPTAHSHRTTRRQRGGFWVSAARACRVCAAGLLGLQARCACECYRGSILSNELALRCGCASTEKIAENAIDVVETVALRCLRKTGIHRGLGCNVLDRDTVRLLHIATEHQGPRLRLGLDSLACGLALRVGGRVTLARLRLGLGGGNAKLSRNLAGDEQSKIGVATFGQCQLNVGIVGNGWVRLGGPLNGVDLFHSCDGNLIQGRRFILQVWVNLERGFNGLLLLRLGLLNLLGVLYALIALQKHLLRDKLRLFLGQSEEFRIEHAANSFVFSGFFELRLNFLKARGYPIEIGRVFGHWRGFALIINQPQALIRQLEKFRRRGGRVCKRHLEHHLGLLGQVLGVEPGRQARCGNLGFRLGRNHLFNGNWCRLNNRWCGGLLKAQGLLALELGGLLLLDHLSGWRITSQSLIQKIHGFIGVLVFSFENGARHSGDSMQLTPTLQELFTATVNNFPRFWLSVVNNNRPAFRAMNLVTGHPRRMDVLHLVAQFGFNPPLIPARVLGAIESIADVGPGPLPHHDTAVHSGQEGVFHGP